MKTLKHLLVQLVAGANFMAAFLLLLCGLSTMLNPAEFPRVALFGLGFPLLLALNLFFVFIWLVFYVRNLWMPFVGMLFSISYIYDYCPLNWPEKHPADALKLVTYNTAFWGGAVPDSLGNYPLLDYLAASDADIICLQEASPFKLLKAGTVDDLMAKAGYQTRHLNDGQPESLCFYTRLPIVSVERIISGETGNGSIAVRLLHGQDTILVVDNHFESYRLTTEDKQKYKEIIKDPEGKDTENNSKELVRKMAKATRQRGPQVDSVLRYINEAGLDAVIACGDFNEPPVSYACRRMSSKLTSAFRQSGNGIGLSYNQKGFYFRIDHVFVSDYWQTYETHIDKSAPWSDHYPLVTCLKKRKI